MIWFSLITVLMLALASGVLVHALRTGRVKSTSHATEANVGIYRSRLSELESDIDAGLLTSEAANEARTDLERELLYDTSGREPGHASGNRSRFAPAAVAILVPVLTLGLYWQLGDWRAFSPVPGSEPNAAERVAYIRENLELLQQAVYEEPGAPQPRLMLGRAHQVLGHPEQAIAVYEAGITATQGAPELMVDLAEVLARQAGGRYAGRPRALLQQAIGASPTLPKGLWLAGVAAMQQDQPERAREHWRRLLRVVPPDSESAQQLRRLVGDSATGNSAQGETRAIVAAVRLAENPQQFAPDTTVFVFARAPDGNGPPLAVKRLTVADLPQNVRLDESMAMVPRMSLARYDRVILEARVSPSGQAEPQPGDMFGRNGPVQVSTEAPVEVIIDATVKAPGTRGDR